MTFYIRRSINVRSPLDGKHYDSITKYEKHLDQKGCQIMSDKKYHELRDKCRDEERTPKKKKKFYNHVHIDLNNDRIIKSEEKDLGFIDYKE